MEDNQVSASSSAGTGYVDRKINEPVNPAPSPTDRAALISSAYPDFNKPSPASEPWTPAPGTPSPTSAGNTLPLSQDDRPVPVVKVLSVRGIEYAMMSIMLWFGAGSLILILTQMILSGSSFEVLAFPVSLLLVCLPGFAFLYLRLRKAELADPSLRLEASKRRFSQITQILAFLTCLFNLVAVVYLLVGMAGGNDADNIGKTLGAAAVTLLIAGGILAYYWADEHKLVR